MKRALTCCLLVACIALGFAQTPPSAESLVSQARQTAAKSGRAVFVRFTASWCGWCHQMEGVLDSKAVKPIWDKYFVSQPIVVLENGDKKKMENPGGEILMNSMGGKDQGIPFYYFVDSSTGKPVASSMMPAGLLCDGKTGVQCDARAHKATNIGCPATADEIKYFMVIIAKAAPKMSGQERATIEEAFKAAAKKG